MITCRASKDLDCGHANTFLIKRQAQDKRARERISLIFNFCLVVARVSLSPCNISFLHNHRNNHPPQVANERRLTPEVCSAFCHAPYQYFSVGLFLRFHSASTRCTHRAPQFKEADKFHEWDTQAKIIRSWGQRKNRKWIIIKAINLFPFAIK